MTNIRFIPAGAGNTTELATVLDAPPVYPRWRGEHRPSSVRQVARYGLSPLARGTLPAEKQRFGLQRFIPAGAGNTS